MLGYDLKLRLMFEALTPPPCLLSKVLALMFLFGDKLAWWAVFIIVDLLPGVMLLFPKSSFLSSFDLCLSRESAKFLLLRLVKMGSCWVFKWEPFWVYNLLLLLGAMEDSSLILMWCEPTALTEMPLPLLLLPSKWEKIDFGTIEVGGILRLIWN